MKKLLFMILLLILVGCTSTTDPIKIGAPLSITSYAAEYGENSRDGIILAVEEINQEGGINGRLVEVIFEDDATDGNNAVSSVSKLINIDNVDVIIGGTWDLSLIPIVPIIEQANLVIINPSTGNTDLNKRISPNLFRTYPSIDFQMNVLKRFVEKEGVKEVVIFRNSGAWGISHKQSLERIMADLGGEIIADFGGPNVDVNDFRTEVTKLKSLNPDAVFFFLGPSDAAQVLNRMKEQDIKVQIFATGGGVSTALRTDAISEEDTEGTYILDILPQDSVFIEKFESRFGKQPLVSSDTAYQAVKLFADAYENTNGETAEIREYLQNSGIFDVYGDTIKHPVPIFRITDGEWVLAK